MRERERGRERKREREEEREREREEEKERETYRGHSENQLTASAGLGEAWVSESEGRLSLLSS